MKEIVIILILLLPIYPPPTVEQLQELHLIQQQETSLGVKELVLLEEGEKLLDYRYISEGELEVFTILKDKYYRKFYILEDSKAILNNQQEIEPAKGGLKTDS